MFKDRIQAANLLAQKLKDLKDTNSVVVALPRGGVPIGAVIAKSLNLEFDIFFVKKIPSPYNKEVAIGAVSENGFVYLNQEAIAMLNISKEYILEQQKEILENIKRKRELYNKPRVDLKDKKVIIVDDGIATGASMILAIDAIKKEKAQDIIVAAPVAPLEVANALENLARVEVLIKDPNFMAVGAYYQDFHQLSDSEVIKILEQFKWDKL